MTSPKKGLLLINLGTPDKPEPEAVGRYLKQFLMDKWVIDIPAPVRWFFVNVLIVPKRKFASAEAYSKVWSESGSPLLAISKELTEKVRARMPDVNVVLGMRYGNPSIRSALEKLRDCDEIVAFPLYPQYAESSTRSSQEECLKQARALGYRGKLSFVGAFYDDPGFLAAVADLIQPVLDTDRPDHVLFSYHGLPERHVKRLDPTGEICRVKESCCDKIVDANRNCYRAHCFETTRKLAAALGLNRDQYSVSFQSRLGRAVWIPPYTEPMLEALAKKGVKKLAVACPSFTADCLETIEEIGIRATEVFTEAGGEKLIRIPCVNAEPKWVDAVEKLARRAGFNNA